ncbi:IclR family transcriptional regulator [Streptomyces bobili]|uniref:IclR family transcriptional regulator n=1 Tax=Streptomyces bobili TaxID=67280 RepID=UPI00364882FA
MTSHPHDSMAERVVARGSRGSSGGVRLQTVERALAFLEIVATSPEPLTVRQVAEALGINVTTCYHLFNTLYDAGYIERNPDQTLRIGFEVAVLYDSYQRGSTPARAMSELVERLAEESRETAWISVYTADSVVLTAFVDGPQPVRATGLHVGLHGNEHVRSSGRAVLAHVDDAARARILDRAFEGVSSQERSAVEKSLEADLEEIRQRGWVLDDEAYIPGIVGVAAPFFTFDGHQVLGSIGIWSPASRAHEDLDRLIEAVTEASHRATAAIGRPRE